MGRESWNQSINLLFSLRMRKDELIWFQRRSSGSFARLMLVGLFVLLVGYGRCPRQGLRQKKTNNNTNQLNKAKAIQNEWSWVKTNEGKSMKEWMKWVIELIAAASFGGRKRNGAERRQSRPAEWRKRAAEWNWWVSGLWAGGSSAASEFHSRAAELLFHFITLAPSSFFIKEKTSQPQYKWINYWFIWWRVKALVCEWSEGTKKALNGNEINLLIELEFMRHEWKNGMDGRSAAQSGRNETKWD